MGINYGLQYSIVKLINTTHVIFLHFYPKSERLNRKLGLTNFLIMKNGEFAHVGEVLKVSRPVDKPNWLDSFYRHPVFTGMIKTK